MLSKNAIVLSTIWAVFEYFSWVCLLNRLSTILSKNSYCLEYYLSNFEHCLSTYVEWVCLDGWGLCSAILNIDYILIKLTNCLFSCILLVLSSGFFFYWGRFMQMWICGVFPHPQAQYMVLFPWVLCTWCIPKERGDTCFLVGGPLGHRHIHYYQIESGYRLIICSIE